MSVRDLNGRVDMDALSLAMQSPLRLARGRRSERQYFVAQLAVQLSLMVSNPPFSPDRRRIAFETIDLICGLNGARLELTDRERTKLAGERGRSPASIRVLERWIDDNLVQLTGREKITLQLATSERVPAPTGRRPVFFISVEHTRIAERERAALASIVDAMRRRIEELASELMTCWPDRAALLEDAEEIDAARWAGSVELRAPAVDDWWLPGDEVCERNRETLWRTSAHITIAPHGGSQGTGEERAMTPMGSRHLVIVYKPSPESDVTSPAIEENLSGRPTTVTHVPDGSHVVDAFEAWVRAEWVAIELTWQQIDVRELQGAALADAFRRALAPLSEEQQRSAMALCGLDARLLGALTNPHGLNWLGPESYHKVAAALGFRAADYDGRMSEPTLSREQTAALLTVVAKLDLDDREARALAAEAERQTALGILRFALVSLGDWIDFREQLRADFGWQW